MAKLGIRVGQREFLFKCLQASSKPSLQGNPGKKYNVSDHVALPEAARLIQQAEEPFHTAFTHPSGGARNFPRQEIEQSADADDRAAKLPEVLRSPDFLSGLSHRDQD
jgi:hypothetical protein